MRTLCGRALAGLVLVGLLLSRHGLASGLFDGQSHVLPYDVSPSAIAVEGRSELVVKGINSDSEARIVILRFDDSRSGDYHSRLNIERLVNPGEFAIYLPLMGLKTSSGRPFDWSTWRRLIVFADRDNRTVSINGLAINDGGGFSSASLGFDLGAADSPVLVGMTRIGVDYAGLKGRYLKARYSVSGNALTTDGIEGVEQLTIPVANGRYQVILWHRMQGEWENLPRQLHQHIKLQGQTVFKRDLTPQQWLASDYFAGQQQEAVIDGSLWQLLGDQPEQRTLAEVTVSTGVLQIDFAGQTTHDNYLAGVFITPLSLNGKDYQALQQSLAEKFKQHWPVVNWPSDLVPAAESAQPAVITTAVPAVITTAVPAVIPTVQLQQRLFTPLFTPPSTPQFTPKATLASATADAQALAGLAQPTVVTLDSLAVLDFAATTNIALNDVGLTLDFTDQHGQAIAVDSEIRQGIWRYQRPLGMSTLLSLSAAELQAVATGGSEATLLRLSEQLPRRINLVVKIPKTFLAQDLTGQLRLWQGQQLLAAKTFTLRVLPFTLPKVRQAIGIYHERAPHWLWFENLDLNHPNPNAKSSAGLGDPLACDLDYLKSLGLTALSPPLTTPGMIRQDQDDQALARANQAYLQDLQRYQQYFSGPAMDYTTIKRLNQYYQQQPLLLQRHLRMLEQQIRQAGLNLPQFAVVDEMLPLDSGGLAQFSQWLAQLQHAMPSASFVGQLNQPENHQLVGLLDTLLVNMGFGADKQQINQLQRQNKSVWLYNIPRMRLAAGFYLWQTGAQGYLQWHGRMPTGAPFNPLDGREADFQMIYPSLDHCPAIPDIHGNLLAISQGIIDRQWLNWLLIAAKTNNKAQNLLNSLKLAVPDRYQGVEQLSERQVHQWRKAITDLAQHSLSL